MAYPPLDPFDLRFATWPHLKCGNKIVTIADAFLHHPGYQGPFPENIAHPQAVKTQATEFIGVSNAAESGDRNQKALRDALRPKAVSNTMVLLQWAAMRSVSENDPSLISNLGVDLKKKPSIRSSSQSVVAAPAEPKAKHGAVTGDVDLAVAKVPNAILYVVYACLGDPSVEESWFQVAESNRCRMVIKGLQEGKAYYFRVKCRGPAGYGPWSSAVRLMVI
jgi:hypothetical protein